jgi:C-terminal processing protease CtpA/Prc
MPQIPDMDVPVSVVVVHSSMRSGLMVENITPQLGEFFGVKNGKGVLVRSVEKGSRAEKSGFRAGDVIVRVNDQPVQDTSDFSHAIRSATTDSVTIGFVRDKHEQNLTLSLPPHKTSGDVWEESFDDLDFNAESFVDLGELHDEWAQMQPQMQYALDESRSALQKVNPEIEKAKREAAEEMERVKPEIERALREAQTAAEHAQHELCIQQKELRRQTENLKREIQKQQRNLMQENRKQMERLRHEMRGEWTQI